MYFCSSAQKKWWKRQLSFIHRAYTNALWWINLGWSSHFSEDGKANKSLRFATNCKLKNSINVTARKIRRENTQADKNFPVPASASFLPPEIQYACVCNYLKCAAAAQNNTTALAVRRGLRNDGWGETHTRENERVEFMLRITHLHGLGMMHRLDGVDGTLFRCVGNKGTAWNKWKKDRKKLLLFGRTKRAQFETEGEKVRAPCENGLADNSHLKKAAEYIKCFMNGNCQKRVNRAPGAFTNARTCFWQVSPFYSWYCVL